MNVQLIQYDSPMPNLALMKLGFYHRSRGDNVKLVLGRKDRWGDIQYRSILFKWGKSGLPEWGINGGPGFDPKITLPEEIRQSYPLYELYPRNDISWGYTYYHCFRKCEFCVVHLNPQNEDRKHYSINTFLNKDFPKICLLNNNTLCDPDWRETFIEIEKEKKIMFDWSGYDLRLLSGEVLEYMERLKWDWGPSFAWDRQEDKDLVLEKLELLEKSSIKKHCIFYVLTGWKYTQDQDLERINILRERHIAVIPLAFNRNNPRSRRLKRWALHKDIFFVIPFEQYKTKTERARETRPQVNKDMISSLGHLFVGNRRRINYPGSGPGKAADQGGGGKKRKPSSRRTCREWRQKYDIRFKQD